MIRQNRNKIDAFRKLNGDWATHPLELETMITEFYKSLFKEERVGNHTAQTYNGFPRLLENLSQLLTQSFSNGEIKKTFFDMAPFKARVLTTSMLDSTRTLGSMWGSPNVNLPWTSLRRVPSWKDPMTLLVLIPKIKHPEQVS